MLSLSQRVKPLKQSGIRSASVRCAEIKGINLGQGICDLPVPALIKEAACNTIHADRNIYSPCEGVKALREALAQKMFEHNQIPTSVSEVMVGHGSTGAFVCAVKTLLNPGDEIILFEPFYGYHKNILELFGVQVKTVSMSAKDFSIDFSELEKKISPQTRGMVVCTPCNPNGKVFSRDELLRIGQLANKHDLCVITDEIYEYITYPGHEHVSLASLEDFRERTITISGFSKTYNMTGWRLGYARAPEHIIEKMALVQDLLYVCPVTPLQGAVISALKMQPNYYTDMRALYLKKRDFVVTALQDMGFRLCVPQGAYYIMADFSELGFQDDGDAMNALLNKAKVATVTGRSFYMNPNDGKHVLRFCYALAEDVLHQAMENLKVLLKA